MSEMNIDLRVIRDWVHGWRANDGVNKTASKMAAVMLGELLEESEGRLSKTELVMSGCLPRAVQWRR